MKFAIQLKGSIPTLQHVFGCFQGDFARIRKIGDDWFLGSSAFDPCASGQDVFPIADELLRLIHRVTAIYGGSFSPFELGYVECFSDAGVHVSRALRASKRIQVYTGEGFPELQEPRGKESLGSALVGAAMADKRLLEALALIGDGHDLQWSQIYNIQEFVGGEDAIVKEKWALREQLRKCRQTANHYRHLARPKKYPLPADPPSLSEATSLVV